MTVDIMLDLETWGKKPGCDLRSIGACLFDPLTREVSIPCSTCKGGTTRGNVNDGGDCSDCMNTRMEQGFGGSFYIATDNPEARWSDSCDRDDGTGVYRKYPLTRDPETVAWWADQSPEAQAAFADPVDLRIALQRFTSFLVNIVPDAPTGDTIEGIRLWSHGASFDIPILAAAYAAVDLPVPWHYRSARDTRTAFDLAEVGDHSAFMSLFNTGTKHHALDDAITQAKAVGEAFSIVRNWHDYSGVS